MKILKKIGAALAIATVLSVIIYQAQVPGTVRMQNPDTAVATMESANYGGSSGYQIDGHLFTPQSPDPQIYFGGHWPQMSNLELKFARPVEQEIGVQLYYGKEGETLSEENSVQESIEPGKDQCVIEIPQGTYSLFRMDVNGTFELAGITMSDSPVIQQRLDRSIPWIPVIIVFVLSGLVMGLLGDRIFDWLALTLRKQYTHWKKQHVVAWLSAVADLLYLLMCLFLMASMGVITHGWYTAFAILAVLVLILKYVKHRNSMREHPEKMFFATVLVLGSLLAILLPVGTKVAFDDEIHFRSADELSHVLDHNITDAERTYFIAQHEETADPQQLSERKQELNNEYLTGRTRHINGPYRTGYTTIPYLPAALALFVARGLCLPMHAMLLVGRLMNVLVYACISFLAMRKLKSGKMILAVIALFPTSMFLAANYSCDAWLTAFVMLAMAYIFSEAMQPDKKITRAEIAVIMISFLIGLSPKAVYFPLMLTGLLLGEKKFEDHRAWRRYQIILILGMLFVIATFVLPILIGGFGTGDIRGSVDVNSTEQVKFVLRHPVTYAVVLVKFLADYLAIHTTAMYMTNFAYMGSVAGWIVIIIMFGLVVITDKSEYDKVISDWKVKLWQILLFFGTCVLVASALYVSYTPVAEHGIWGCQPRYIIPLLFPLMIVIGSSRIRVIRKRNIYHTAVLSVMSLVMYAGIWQICINAL